MEIIQTKRALDKLDLKAKKSLGQHFLIDRHVLGKVVKAAELAPDDMVVEVGPGLGILTRELAARAGQVTAVEIDRRMISLLEDVLRDFANVRIINGDILETNLSFLETGRPYKVVANLPYYIASAVLRLFLEAEHQPELMVAMIQKEVAQEIAARSGKLGLLGVAVQVYARPEIISYVLPSSFYPPPKVSSAILKLVPHSNLPFGSSDRESFFRVVKAGFQGKRKQIVNSLSQGLGQGKVNILNLLSRAGLEPHRRAETLSLEEWLKLWSCYEEMFDEGAGSG